jgi:hypothetical protein
MAIARRVTIQGANSTPIVEDLSPSEEPDFNARLAAAPAIDAANLARQNNGATLQQRVRDAIAANLVFLGLTPIQQQAQVLQQTVRLTRQWNALARLVVNQLDDTAGA